VAALAKSEPELLQMKPAAKPLRWLWAGMAVLILLTPIGALAPGTAWGEWGGEELDSLVGYVPTNLERLGGLWKAAMPDYATPGVSNTLLGYLIAALVGTVLTVGVAWGVGALLARHDGGRAGSAAEVAPDPPTTQAR